MNLRDLPDQEPPTSIHGVLELLHSMAAEIERADTIKHCSIDAEVGTVSGASYQDGEGQLWETATWNGEKSVIIKLRYQMPLG